MKRYFLLCSRENMDIVKGILDFLVEDFIVLPDLLDSDQNGLIFTIRSDCQSKWDTFYYKLLIDKDLAKYGEIICNEEEHPETRKLTTDEKPVRTWNKEINQQMVKPPYPGENYFH